MSRSAVHFDQQRNSVHKYVVGQDNIDEDEEEYFEEDDIVPTPVQSARPPNVPPQWSPGDPNNPYLGDNDYSDEEELDSAFGDEPTVPLWPPRAAAKSKAVQNDAAAAMGDTKSAATQREMALLADLEAQAQAANELTEAVPAPAPAPSADEGAPAVVPLTIAERDAACADRSPPTRDTEIPFGVPEQACDKEGRDTLEDPFCCVPSDASVISLKSEYEDDDIVGARQCYCSVQPFGHEYDTTRCVTQQGGPQSAQKERSLRATPAVPLTKPPVKADSFVSEDLRGYWDGFADEPCIPDNAELTTALHWKHFKEGGRISETFDLRRRVVDYSARAGARASSFTQRVLDLQKGLPRERWEKLTADVSDDQCSFDGTEAAERQLRTHLHHDYAMALMGQVKEDLGFFRSYIEKQQNKDMEKKAPRIVLFESPAPLPLPCSTDEEEEYDDIVDTGREQDVEDEDEKDEEDEEDETEGEEEEEEILTVATNTANRGRVTQSTRDTLADERARPTITSVQEESSGDRPARSRVHGNRMSVIEERESAALQQAAPILNKSKTRSIISTETSESALSQTVRRRQSTEHTARSTQQSKHASKSRRRSRRLASVESGTSSAQKSWSTGTVARQVDSAESPSTSSGTASIRKTGTTEASGPRVILAASDSATEPNSRTTRQAIRRVVSAESDALSTQKSSGTTKSIRHSVSTESDTSSAQKSQGKTESIRSLVFAESGISSAQKSRSTGTVARQVDCAESAITSSGTASKRKSGTTEASAPPVIFAACADSVTEPKSRTARQMIRRVLSAESDTLSTQTSSGTTKSIRHSISKKSGTSSAQKSQDRTESIRGLVSAESGISSAQKSWSTGTVARQVDSAKSAITSSSTASIRKSGTTEASAPPVIFAASTDSVTEPKSRTTRQSIHRVVSAESDALSAQKSESIAKSIRRVLSTESATFDTLSMQKSQTTVNTRSSTAHKSRTTTSTSKPDVHRANSVASSSAIISAAAPHTCVLPPAHSAPTPAPAYNSRSSPPTSPVYRTTASGGTPRNAHPPTSPSPAPASHAYNYVSHTDDLIHSDVFRRLVSRRPDASPCEHTGPPRLGSPFPQSPESLSYDIRPPARQSRVSKRDIGRLPAATPALSGALSSNSQSLYLVSHAAPPSTTASDMNARYAHPADVFRSLVPLGR